MTNEYQIRVVPEVAAQEDRLKAYLADEQGIDVRTIYGVRILKRSIDARQRQIYVNLKVRVYVNEQPHDDEFVRTEYPNVEGKPQVIVVGAGPGGLFAALRLIELGLRPIVLERGKNVHDRKKDLANITKTQKVDAESNYCFGEGGAGAYSDGKLYTRSKKRGNTDKILNVFCSGRCPSPYRHRPSAEGHRGDAQHHHQLWRRSAFSDEDDGADFSRKEEGERRKEISNSRRICASSRR